MKRKTLEEMNLLDDFLNNAMASIDEVNEEYFRIVLSVLLERELKKIKIEYQKSVFASVPGERGIRMDVEISETDENEGILTIYDWEPHIQRDLHFAKHSRFYQAKIDGKHMESGDNNFGALPELFIITITNFDIFGNGRMVNTFRMMNLDDPTSEYDDGICHVYFNTKGEICDSESIRNMLKYIGETRKQNVVDSATKQVDALVSRVKDMERIRSGFMTWDEVVDWQIKEGIKEGLQEAVAAEVAEIKQRMIEEAVQEAVQEAENTHTRQLATIICRMLLRNITDPTVIADHTGLDIAIVESILKQVAPYAPDYNLPENLVITI